MKVHAHRHTDRCKHVGGGAQGLDKTMETSH